MTIPLLNLIIAIVGLLDMTRLHHHLGRCPVDILLEACKQKTEEAVPVSIVALGGIGYGGICAYRPTT